MKKIAPILRKALVEAGEILVKGSRKPKRIRYKSRANLVTETDRSAEEKIARLIKKKFPDHDILAEESQAQLGTTRAKSLRTNSPYRWIVDPLDGTTNFAHDLPVSAVSIGFEDHGKITVGGVFNPFSKELFWAEFGKGALLNGKPIHVSTTPTLEKSLLVTGFPYDRARRADQYMRVVSKFLKKSQGIRRLGAAALDCCYVACGRFDGFWEQKLNPWDQAAGFLIAMEAGATCTDFSGEPFHIYKHEVLLTNGKIHGEMLKVLGKYVEQR